MSQTAPLVHTYDSRDQRIFKQDTIHLVTIYSSIFIVYIAPRLPDIFSGNSGIACGAFPDCCITAFADAMQI